MSRGVGRGRGWLNLARNQATKRPGGLIYSHGDVSSTQMQTKNDMANYTDVTPPMHLELINRVQQLSLLDDGICFNRKIRLILEYWKSECNTKDKVENSFDSLYNAALQSTELASKVVLMVASNSFVKQEVNELNIRHLFLKHLQVNFENANQLRIANPVTFRNIVHMLGEFYHKARSLHGNVYKFLAVPFISSLEMLLECKSVPEVALFATQLYLNGSIVEYEKPEETASILTKVRTILVEKPGLLRETKLWLLLTLELSNNKFGNLPNNVYKFYESQLGNAALLNFGIKFTKNSDVLSVQTVHSSKIVDSYQSPVNVSEISTPQKLPNNETTPQFNNVPQYIDRGLSEYSHRGNRKDNFNKIKEKPCLPIFGAEARSVRIRSKQDSEILKESNENSTGWSNKHRINPGVHWGDSTDN